MWAQENTLIVFLDVSVVRWNDSDACELLECHLVALGVHGDIAIGEALSLWFRNKLEGGLSSGRT